MLFFGKKSYFVQKNRTWCRKGKILEVGCRYKKKNKADDRYKKFNDGRFRLCQELRTTVFYFKRHLEHQYRQAFAEAAKVADPTWRAGKPIPAGALDGITRESAESGRKSVDIKL